MYSIYDRPLAGFTVILLDVEWIETPEEFLTTMAAELLAIDRVRRIFADIKSVPSALSRWISNVIEEVGVGLGNVGELKIRLRQSLSNADAWQELAEQILGTLRTLPERIVLILDEFPLMISSMLDRDGATAVRFLRWFRTFRQSPGTDRLIFLLGGSTNIEPRLESLGNEAVLGDLQRLRIMPFAPGMALNFITELLVQEQMDYELGVPQEILATCQSGVPYYLQTILAECLAEARRWERRLNVQDVRIIYEERVIGPINRHRFSHYQTRLRHYGPLEDVARLLLASLCHGGKSTDELARTIVAAGYERAKLEPVLILLEGDYYILRDRSTVSFSDGLLQDWWVRNTVPPKEKA